MIGTFAMDFIALDERCTAYRYIAPVSTPEVCGLGLGDDAAGWDAVDTKLAELVLEKSRCAGASRPPFRRP